MDKDRSHATIYGHPTAVFEQDGILYDGAGNPLKPPKKTKGDVIETAGVEKAKEFLQHVLKENPLSKAAIFKASEESNQNWNEVRDAFLALGVQKFQYQNMEMWKLVTAE